MEVTRVSDISILHLFGEVSFLEMNRIEKTLASLRRSNFNKVLLDLSSVDHVHYMVMKRLVENAVDLRNKRGDIKLAGLNDETREILRFTGADQYLQDYASISEAILSFLKKSADNTVFQ
jgi:anti-anti-sigma factor